MLLIKRIKKNEHSAAQAFYNVVGYNHEIMVTDEVVTAEVDGEIVGVGRIAIEYEYYVLRGMQVEQSYQKRNIGSQILIELSHIIGKHECFCLPYTWLEKFYQKIKFKKFAEEMAPHFLQQRISDNREKGYNLIMMKRQSS